MTDAVRPDERAGWWRRTAALVIDSLCVIIPSAVLGALLFTATGGYLQWSGPGLEWQNCTAVTSIPADLDPPPPANSNQAKLCQFSSFAGPVGRILIVAHTVRENNSVTSIARDYTLQASGRAGGYDLSWLTWIAFLTLLICSEWRFGATPGKILFGMKVIAIQSPRRRSVPLKQVVTRYGIAIGVILLLLAIALAILLIPVMLGRTPSGFAVLAYGFLLATSAAWQIWNMVRIVRRSPAVYDAMAKVEVVRTRMRPETALAMPEEPAPA